MPPFFGIFPRSGLWWVSLMWVVLFPCLYPCKAFPVAPVNVVYLSPPPRPAFGLLPRPQGAGAVMAISEGKPCMVLLQSLPIHWTVVDIAVGDGGLMWGVLLPCFCPSLVPVAPPRPRWKEGVVAIAMSGEQPRAVLCQGLQCRCYTHMLCNQRGRLRERLQNDLQNRVDPAGPTDLYRGDSCRAATS